MDNEIKEEEIADEKGTKNYYLQQKTPQGWYNVTNRKTGKTMMYNGYISAQVAKCKMFGIGQADVRMMHKLPKNQGVEIKKDWSK